MFTLKTLCLLVLLSPVSVVAWGQKVAPSNLETSVATFANKIFLVKQESEPGNVEDDLRLFFLFHEGGKATFRVRQGKTIIKDSPISWRLISDSLCLQASPLSLEADGKLEVVERAATKYRIVKAPGGYLLKGQDDEMLLLEQQ